MAEAGFICSSEYIYIILFNVLSVPYWVHADGLTLLGKNSAPLGENPALAMRVACVSHASDPAQILASYQPHTKYC
jgi:hypothetical protein